MAAVTRPTGPDEPAETPLGQYFAEDPAVTSRPSTVTLTLPDRTLHLVTDRGVFSPTRIDPGTKLLLMELSGDLAGPVLDLGCGYGPIACTVAARQPGAQVWAVDVNRRARELTAQNAAELGLEVRVSAPEEVTDGVRFATIVSNPPIRIGKAAMRTLLATWLDRLTPEGAAWLVVNKNLGADSTAAWLVERGHTVERVRSRQGYRILRVSAASSAPLP